MGLLDWLFGQDSAGQVDGVFAASADGMPDVGQGDGWTERRWRRAPVRAVRVADLVATNRDGYLDSRVVERYAAGGGDALCVVEHDGRFYVADGHHRVAAAIARGERTIEARVMRGGDR